MRWSMGGRHFAPDAGAFGNHHRGEPIALAMKTNPVRLLLPPVLLASLLAAADSALAAAGGPFEPTMNSLTNYQCPEWFRDAKFGIWAHWGPQAVPMAGDWYAKHMYVQGHRQYQDHLERYGHPSTNGWKDIVPLWRAEKWDPDRLMALYKQAGARYFVSMGSHHDNFFLWNSKLHPWNAVQVGPKRDVVGDWQRAAKKLGLPFGVSEHLGASFTWWQDSHKADKTGPLAGVPYDGADAKNQALYHFPADANDKAWYSNNPRWQQMWSERIRELVDNYQPDLLYTDGGVPFGNEVGLGLIAHYYNESAAQHGGKPEVIYNCKQKSGGRWVEDLERGVMPGINPYPWQTDTSIGDWFYNKNWKFRPVSWTIHMLVDIVSKNGNLLLNVVQRPDGSLDPEVEQDLARLAGWIAINGEAIYATRPWLVYGEGPTRAKGGHFKEDFAYSARDVRFTAKGDTTLYALALGWPEDRKLVIRSLARLPGVEAKISRVQLLGSAADVKWTETPGGLQVELPAQKPCDYAIALKVTGENLRGFKPDLAAPAMPVVLAEPTGNFTLAPDDAELHGEGIKTEAQGGQPNLGFWDRADEWASWKVDFSQPGKFKLTASVATVHASVALVAEVAGQKLAGKPTQTGAWDKFAVVDFGQVELKAAGQQTLSLKPRDEASWKAVNLRWVKLERVR
jgi:alpha-L-fucosidase